MLSPISIGLFAHPLIPLPSGHHWCVLCIYMSVSVLFTSAKNFFKGLENRAEKAIMCSQLLASFKKAFMADGINARYSIMADNEYHSSFPHFQPRSQVRVPTLNFFDKWIITTSTKLKI